jgi:hypothetical protein
MLPATPPITQQNPSSHYEPSFRAGHPLAGLAQLNLPSRIHQSDERQLEFQETREKLVRLGIAEGSGLSGLGAYADKWIGTGDLAYAVELQKEMESNDPSLQRFLFWAVAHAASDLTLRELLTTGGSYQLDEDILDELTIFNCGSYRGA